MASRFLLNLRGGASAAARSARGRHLPAGRTWGPAMSRTTGALADAGTLAGRIPAVQGVRHYGTPSSPSITELNRAIRNLERRLDALERHEKEKVFNRITNGVMAVGFGITFSVVAYYNFPWMSAESHPTV